MRDDDKFSEEAMCFSGLIQEVLLVHSAFDVLLRARCDALQAALTNMCEHSDVIQPTAEAVRKFVDDRTMAIVDNELARLADDDMARVSLIRRMLGSIFQKEN